MAQAQTLVARIGKAHALRGEVTVQVHTDVPQERFVPGTVFTTDPASAGPLTLSSARLHQGTWLLGFEGVSDRSAAEALRNTKLLLDLDEADDDDDDGWYEEDLVGLRVESPSGEVLGTVSGLLVRPAQDLLVVTLTSGGEALVPFVEAIVPEVDPEAGRIVLDAPDGLLDLQE